MDQTDNEIEKYDKPDFNIFKLFDQLGREKAFCEFLNKSCSSHLAAIPLINKEVFAEFIKKAHAGYFQPNVTYHNDLHGIDVS